MQLKNIGPGKHHAWWCGVGVYRRGEGHSNTCTNKTHCCYWYTRSSSPAETASERAILPEATTVIHTVFAAIFPPCSGKSACRVLSLTWCHRVYRLCPREHTEHTATTAWYSGTQQKALIFTTLTHHSNTMFYGLLTIVACGEYSCTVV